MTQETQNKQIIIASNTYIICSKFSLEELEMVKKYRPQALRLIDEETGEELFAIGLGSNSVSSVGISFGGSSRGDESKAIAEINIPPDVENREDYVVETVGASILKLNKVEASLAQVISEVRQEQEEAQAEQEALRENIATIL